MKHLLLVTLISFSFITSNAQKEAWKWYFGNYAAMDFSGGAPVALYDCAMSQWEGSASIADHDGNLLFYTDGVSVWNKNNTLMPNGYGLYGDPSSTQSALIVPKPGSDSIYYIFTTSGYWAHYSEVDMSLDGGLGDVTANKNIQISNNSAEKLAGVHASNGIDFWVSIHQNYSSTFLSYYVDTGGVNLTPVVSVVGNILNGNIGQLQFAPNGKRAAMASYSSPDNETIEVFDFNDTTGTFSNQIGLPTPAYFQTYGLEFSPSSKILYTGANPGIDQVHRWNLDAGTVADIIASDSVVGNTLGDVGSFQLGPDGKIYVAQYFTNYVGVINSPDSLHACDWNANGVDVSPGQCELGLPNFLISLVTEQEPQIAFYSDLHSVCQKFCVSYFDSSQNNPVSWLWTFEGGSPPTSTDQNPANVCYNLPGTYDVSLVTTDANGITDSLTLPDYITVYATPPFPDITQNGYTLTSSAAASYQWQLNSVDIPGATNQSYDVMQTGYYTVLVTDENGCKNSSTLYVQIVGIDEVNSDLNFSVFPNPSSGIFNIECPENLSIDNIDLKIFNALGQLIYSAQKIQSLKSYEVDLSKAAPGVYTIQLKTTNAVANKKINVVH